MIEIWKQIEHLDRRLMPKLTKRTVDAAEVRSSDYFVWDDELPGFGLRVLPSGRKRYVVQYRAGRRSRRISLGPSTVLACEQARNQAMTIIAAARNGEDLPPSAIPIERPLRSPNSPTASMRSTSHCA